MKTRILIMALLVTMTASAQENLQRQASDSKVGKTFTTVKELPITSVKNQYRSGTCWAYASLGYFESEILRQTGKHPEYLKRMIAAYVIGYSITGDFLAKNKHLKFAEKADDTGVIISWNTEGPGNKDKKNFVVVDGAISINPLNWKRDDTYAPASENLGARIMNQTTKKYEIIPEAADAQVDTERGVVVTTTKVIEPIDDSLGMGFGPDSFHHADYSLYYNNIKANVAERCAAYQK